MRGELGELPLCLAKGALLVYYICPGVWARSRVGACVLMLSEHDTCTLVCGREVSTVGGRERERERERASVG